MTIPFIATWDTTKVSGGGSEYNQIKLPLVSGGTYNFDINWGDGNSETITAWDQSGTMHSYETPNIYEINIDGVINGWSFADNNDRQKLLDVIQWGDLLVSDGGNQFNGCGYFTCSATDTLNISGITNMSYMFANCFEFTHNISNWDVSNVTDMSYMLQYCWQFNHDLSNWDVSKVTNMSGLFNGCESFNSNISNWTVSGVTDMSYMFDAAKAFNQDLSSWDVSNVTTMSYMFFNAQIFNQDISSWNISGVTNMDNLIYLNTVFSTTNYDKLLNSWSLQSVQPNVLLGVYQTTYTAVAAKEILTSAPNNWIITDGGLYSAATTTTTTTVMPAGEFISTWVTSRGDNASSNSIKLPLVSGGTYSFTVIWGDGSSDYISAWDQAEINHIYASGGTYIVEINGLINGWKFIGGHTDEEKIDNINQWGCLQFGNGGGMGGCVNLNCSATDIPNLSGITDMSSMFFNCYYLVLDASSWDVSNATNMAGMFSGCYNFKSDLSQWRTGNVVDMRSMFSDCSNFTSDLSQWDTANVTDMSGMFYQCTSFTSNLSQWITSAVIDMNNMFNMCTLFSSDLSQWDVSNVTQMYLMFYRCTNFNSNLSGWNVSKVIDMGEMYNYAKLSIVNYSNMLISWSMKSVQSDVSLGANDTQYLPSAESARTFLMSAPNNWMISDAGLFSGTITSLDLTFDNISNADTLIGGSSSDVSLWNTLFDLPNNGTSFTSVAVDGNTVSLDGGVNIHLRDYLFINNVSLLSIVAVNCVTTAGDSCFQNCTAATSFSLPALTTAGDSCFYNCTAATSFSLPALTTAGNGCFYFCTAATSFSLPALTTVGDSCFQNCTAATSFSLPALITVGDYCFYLCTAATTFDLSSCTNLGGTTGDNNVFYGISTNSIDLTIPSALLTVNNGNPDGDIQYLQANNTVTIVRMVLQKKIQPKIFTEYDPTDVNNMASGFSLGQVWHNTLTNKEFIHDSDGVWISNNIIVEDSFNGIYVLYQNEYDALNFPVDGILYFVREVQLT
jgi:surface protein